MKTPDKTNKNLPYKVKYFWLLIGGLCCSFLIALCQDILLN